MSVPISSLQHPLPVFQNGTFTLKDCSFSSKATGQILAPEKNLQVPRIDALVIIIVTVLCKWPAGTNIAVAVGVGVAICSMSYAWNSADTFEVIVSDLE